MSGVKSAPLPDTLIEIESACSPIPVVVLASPRTLLENVCLNLKGPVMSPFKWFSRKFSTRIYIFAISVLIFGSVMSLWASAKVGWRVPTQTSSQQVDHQHFGPHVPRFQGAASQAPSSITVETITLTPLGFEPNQIERAAGRFLLGIDNRIIREEFSFEILRENGHKAHKLKIEKGQIRLRKLLNLTEGRYVLRAVDHPEWTCTIVISQ